MLAVAGKVEPQSSPGVEAEAAVRSAAAYLEIGLPVMASDILADVECEKLVSDEPETVHCGETI